MDARTKIGAGVLGISTAVTGTIDATTLKEVPLERLEIVAEERVEAKQIGNRVETTFPWKDQEGIKITYDMGAPGVLERVRDKRKREVITEVVDFGDGGFKIDILLNEKPDTNRFCYLIEGAEQYDFFYQPPLTAEEIEQGAERPEEIVGSYAVYHKELKNHVAGRENYATGKVMHIPRPQVWELNDEENTKEWAELSYEDGELCVTARQEFLDEATYPVRIDPTFGYTSVGASQATAFEGYTDNEYIAGTAFTLSEDAAVESISVGTWLTDMINPGGSIFLEDGNGANSHTLIAGPASGARTGDFTTHVLSAELTAGNYILAMTQDDFSGGSSVESSYRFDSTGSNRWYYQVGYYNGNVPSTWSRAESGTGRNFSIYVTYTSGGGGGSPTPAQDVIWFD